jgi:hypothetical protein
MINGGRTKIRLGSMKVNGIRGKLKDIKETISELKIDFLVISEIWLRKEDILTMKVILRKDFTKETEKDIMGRKMREIRELVLVVNDSGTSFTWKNVEIKNKNICCTIFEDTYVVTVIFYQKNTLNNWIKSSVSY